MSSNLIPLASATDVLSLEKRAANGEKIVEGYPSADRCRYCVRVDLARQLAEERATMRSGGRSFLTA